ncbi:trypsin-like serine protease [Catenovulum sp. SM1970]|uniref:trypsin-like serine protease n=1 Tax=Marinifaba aquimaris TaxID=2741323 RepID=UPI001572427F|nr:trypsin-like serine protease [Marinifaba aquimaris]NTS77189.1 trypsin-like serine protease [Marinifaba aquimaris]
MKHLSNNPNQKQNKHKFNLKKAIILALTAGYSLLPTSVSAESQQVVDPQIVGGKPTTPGSRPYQVALLMNGRQGCGGTLISSQWVLTAAHCLDNVSTSSLTVRVGAHSISANDGQTIGVSQIIKHEYWAGANGIRSGNDIGLLRLASPAPANITPASLPTQALADQYAGVGQYITVSGWGLTYNQGSPSDTLREVDLPVISNSQCSSELRFNLPSSVICGGGPNGTSACNGDSGGPYAFSANGKFYSAGTVSWGQACRGATAFTRTTSYLDWIEGKTGIKPDDGSGSEDALPVARFTHSVNGLTVSFNNSSTDDKGVVSHSWELGDGNRSSDINPVHNYQQAGTYTVVLTVTDTKGQTDSVSDTVTVSGGDNGGDDGNKGCDGLPAWNATTGYKLSDVVSHKGSKYEAIWWSTGADPQVFSNVWKNLGQCSGGDNGGDQNQAPNADFTVAKNGLTVSLTDNSSDDKGVVSHVWNLGDGSSSNSASLNHTYAQAGTYTVTLTVRDAEGLSDTSSVQVTVAAGGGDNGSCNGLANWQATQVYNNGDRVAYQGHEYKANWWTQNQNPAENSGPWSVWTKVGVCN